MLQARLTFFDKTFSLANLTYNKCILNSTCKDLLLIGLKFIEKLDAMKKIKIPQLGDLIFGFVEPNFYSDYNNKMHFEIYNFFAEVLTEIYDGRVKNVSLIDLPSLASSRISSLNVPYFSLFQTGIDPMLFEKLGNDYSAFLSNESLIHPCIHPFIDPCVANESSIHPCISNGSNLFCNFMTRKLIDENFKTFLEILKESSSNSGDFQMAMKEDFKFTEKFVKNSTILAKRKLQLDLSPRKTEIGMILFCDFIQNLDDIKYEVGCSI